MQRAFNDFPIYVLAPIDQQKIRLANQMAQRPQLMTAGTLSMNMDLFVSVEYPNNMQCKSLYTFLFFRL